MLVDMAKESTCYCVAQITFKLGHHPNPQIWNLLFQTEVESQKGANSVFTNPLLYTVNGALPTTTQTAHISRLRLSDDPAAETHISAGEMKRQEGGSECTIRMQGEKSAFFQHFSSASGAQTACVRSRLKCINTLTSKTICWCLHARAISKEEPGYDQARRVSINHPARQHCKQTS